MMEVTKLSIYDSQGNMIGWSYFVFGELDLELDNKRITIKPN